MLWRSISHVLAVCAIWYLIFLKGNSTMLAQMTSADVSGALVDVSSGWITEPIIFPFISIWQRTRWGQPLLLSRNSNSRQKLVDFDLEAGAFHRQRSGGGQYLG